MYFPKSFFGGISYHSSGVSIDCNHAFFYNDTEISVYDLRELETNLKSPSLVKFKKHFKNEGIRNVALSQTFLLVATSKYMLTIDITKDLVIDTIEHTDWDPSGLASYETDTYLVVLLGQCQCNPVRKVKGQIKVYKYKIDGRPARLSVGSTISLPDYDSPKRLCIDADAQIVTCVTKIQNKILVWKMDDEFATCGGPFEFLKNRSTPVRVQSTAPRPH